MSAENAIELLLLLWPLSEIILGVATRAKRSAASVRDRGSLAVLWIVITVAIFAGFALHDAHVARMSRWALWAGLVLLAVGLAIRWTAIITLGRFFSSNVAIQAGHRIVRAGMYRYVRHPSYTGLLLAFFGFGLHFRSWLSLIAIVVPITAALLYRIKVEEAALREAFGSEYTEYAAGTKRLVPGVY
jgi:protein-S-isoprenylcysteine O-methyltransferase Ste14